MSILNTISDKGISRRGFVGASAAAMSALALGGCSSADSKLTSVEEQNKAEEGAEWVATACWGNCGGRCLNKMLVKDGIVLRQKTDDTKEDSVECPQQRGCLRGRSMRQYITGPDRLRYPLKRKHWQPGGGENAHGELRGIDEWEQISWDEATDLIAQEIKRVNQQYGNRSVFAMGTEIQNFFGKLGGFITRWGATSTGTWTYASACIGMHNDFYGSEKFLPDRMDFQNAESIVMVGMNPAWASAGSPMYFANLLREKGIRFTAVDPFYNDTYSAMDAKWIPVRPATDTALFLGVAYEMLRLDKAEGGFINWDFLDKYCIGFDADHMPEGEDPTGNFMDYVLGTYDHTPKTPAWASAICGVSEEDITYLARELAANRRTTLLGSWAPARCQDVDSWPQLFMTIGCMGGHLGKPGEVTGIACWFIAFNGGPTRVKGGGSGIPSFGNPNKNDLICDTELWPGIDAGQYTFVGKKLSRVPAQKRDIDIRIIYIHGADPLHSKEEMNTGIKVFRKMDMVVTHSHVMSATAKYADIVLPAASLWERNSFSSQQNPEVMFMYSPAIKGFYETKSDQDIVKMLCPKVGIDPNEMYPISVEQQWYNQVAGATLLNEKNEKVPLITITESDIKEMGAEGKPQKGLISYQDYKKNGLYQIKRTPGDGYSYIPYKDFFDDPEGHPLPTESGKFEIYCKKYADNINSFGWSVVKPIPTYVPAPDGYEGTKTTAYHYQMFSPHYLRSSHYEFDENLFLREAWKRPVFINVSDAAKEGIEDGDAVLITSRNGKVVRNARLTERIIPGAIALPHGGESDVDEETGIDFGGSDNILTASRCTGQMVDGYNSCLVKIELYKKGGMPEDLVRPKVLTYTD